MEKYDLSTITRDNLLKLLSKANEELGEYTRCCKEIEECREKKSGKMQIYGGALFNIGFLFLLSLVGLESKPVQSLFFIFILAVLIFILIYRRIKYKKAELVF